MTIEPVVELVPLPIEIPAVVLAPQPTATPDVVTTALLPNAQPFAELADFPTEVLLSSAHVAVWEVNATVPIFTP